MTTAALGFTVNDPRLNLDQETHTYRLGDRVLRSVTQILADVGLADFSAPYFTEAVMARGTALHQAIALDVEGSLVDASGLASDTYDGFMGWRKFLADTGAVVEWWETRLCDPALGVAGTMDGIVLLPHVTATFRARRYLIDVKRALYPCAAIQLAGYVDMAAQLYDEPLHLQRAALVLPGDGTYRLHEFTDPLDRATWQAALRIHAWRVAHVL